jgi:hypothetical protein
MLLKEFITINRNQNSFDENDRYDPSQDVSVIDVNDLRKSRLTLKMLNKLRKAGEAREQEQKDDLELIVKMYATPQENQPQL